MKKIAVCLQLYHTDLWPEFEKLMYPYREHIKLYVALCEEKNFEAISYDAIRNKFIEFDHHVSYHKNYGADIAPFLHQLQLLNEDFFIKIHSKKSRFGKNNQVNWRAILLNDFFASKELFLSNIESISNPECGMVCSKQFLLKNLEDNNSEKIKHLCKMLNMNYEDVKNSKFAAGTMFLSKSKIFQDKLNHKFFKINELLQQESGDISSITTGSYSHSLERIFGYIIEQENLKFCFPKHETIKVINKEAPNKEYFNLVKLYNNECYITEDPKIFGEYSVNENNQVIINWKHTQNSGIKVYDRVGDSATIKAQVHKSHRTLTLPEDFDPKEYKTIYADLSGLNDEELVNHYLDHGIKEKRIYKIIKRDFGPSLYPIFINHDCNLSGAPIFLYDFVTYLKENNIIKNPIIVEPYENNNFDNYEIDKLYHHNDPNRLLGLVHEINPVFIYNNSLSIYFYNINKFKDYWYKTYFHFHETLYDVNKNSLAQIKDQKILVVADRIKKEFETIGCTNVSIFPPFVPQEKIFHIQSLSSKPQKTNNKVTIGMSGTSCERKNPNLFYKLANAYPQYDFIWIGGEPDWAVCESKPLDNLKHIPNTKNPYSYFANLDYFFLTSKRDPCPIVILENLLLNNRVITIKNNIFYQHNKITLKDNLIEIEENEEDKIIDAFGSLNLSKYIKNDIGANYIKQNFSKPKIIKSTREKNNFLIFNFYKKNNDYNNSQIKYFVNIINNFNINNSLSYKVFINVNVENGFEKKLSKEKEKFFTKKYKEYFDSVLNLENIELSVNMGWDLNGLLSCVNKIYANNNLEENNQKLAYLHSKSNLLWREELNKIFYLREDEIEPYDTVINDRFCLECKVNDLNRAVLRSHSVFDDVYEQSFKFIGGTIFITKLHHIKKLYDLNKELKLNLTTMSTKNDFWVSCMKDKIIFDEYYNYYLHNIYNEPIDLESKEIVEKGLAHNFLELYNKFGKKGIPDFHFEHALERYIGFLILENKKVLTV
jgi:hypothetical protein